MTIITYVILAITILVSYLSFQNRELFNKLSHHPYSVAQDKEYYRWITSGLVHGDWIHLGINMFVLWQFGGMVETILSQESFFGATFGPIVFLLFYIFAIIAADIPYFAKHKNDPTRASVGASGAIAALLFVYMMFFPWQKVYLYGVIPIYTILGGIAYLAYETYAHKKNRAGDRTNHLAHLFGALFGIVGIIALKPSIALIFWNNLIQNAPF